MRSPLAGMLLPAGLVVAAAGCAPQTVSPAPAVAAPPGASDAEHERRLDAMFATLPEPSADRAFTFEGDVEYGVPDRGSFRIEVTAAEHDGRPAWRVVQDESTPAFPNGMRASTAHRELWLSRDLRVLSSRTTSAEAGRPPATHDDPPAPRRLPLAAALIWFRACPAEITAEADPVPWPVVSRVDADGTILGCAFTNDSCQAIITLRGEARTPVLVKRFIGWHDMGTMTAREAAK